MPQIIRHIDSIVLERGEPVLFIHFGDVFGDFDETKGDEILNEIQRQGYDYEACAAPSWSGWITGGPHLVAFSVRYAPGEESYESLRRIFEAENGEPLDPEVKLYLLDPQTAFRLRSQQGPRERDIEISRF